MSLLDRKLRRDILAMRGQVFTIALLIAAGVAVFVGSLSTYFSLQASFDSFYAKSHFPQVFVSLKRAPLSVLAHIRAMDGVVAIQPRIVKDVLLDRPSAPQPVSARMISLGSTDQLARLYMRAGRAPQPGASSELAVNEAFAEANKISPGDEIRVLLNGKVQTFHVTGIALSAEYVYAAKPGLPIPDDRLYAILWIDRSAAEAAFDMKAAFNDVLVLLAPNVEAAPILVALDRELERYGAVGAIERRDQASNRFLEDELSQQKVTSVTIPVLFFAVAVFLLNSAMARVVGAQREQIAALKALGFPTWRLLLHYLAFVLIIGLTGWSLGLAGAVGLGKLMMISYHSFFRVPELTFSLSAQAAAASAGISAMAGSLGVFTALMKVVRLTPAVAMRPPAPPKFHRLSRLVPNTGTSPRLMMILRNAAGRPLRSLLTLFGIAVAVPMVVLGIFWRDAIDRMVEVQFGLVERGNVSVSFPHPIDEAVLRDLARLPGVLSVEGQRIVPVRLRAGHRSYLTSVIGLSPTATLRRPHDDALRPIAASPDGLILSHLIAQRLGVMTGGRVIVETMEGRRAKAEVLVSAVVKEALGVATYMDIGRINQLTAEGHVISSADLYVERDKQAEFARRLKQLPTVESLTMKASSLSSFLEKIAGLVYVSAGILTTFAAIITVGVVYNSARMNLQERAWELASLRVLGFTQSETSNILFTELAAQTVVAIPLGLAMSQGIIELITNFHSNESFQIPAVIEPRTYLIAAAFVFGTVLISAYVVRRRANRLDLIVALKTRE